VRWPIGSEGSAALILCDSGPLLAVLDGDDPRHAEATAFFARTHEAVAAPASVVFELAGLVSRRLDARAVARFAESVASGELRMVDTLRADMQRAGALVVEYASLRLGLVDATIVAVAERLGVRTLASFDWRHFGVVRPRHGPLTLVP
jgi:hypothetical protein